MNTPELYELFLKFPKICIDSREAEAGSLFFALKGDKFNGNSYVAQALKKCDYAVVDDPEAVISDKCILVNDALGKLQSLAKYHRKRLGLPIIAITGTNGKTTTKELVARVLAKKFNVGFTQGNFNNHIGVPLTLLKLTSDHEFGIIEMGANHRGEIAVLCKIAAPDFGLITNVGKAHLEGFGSFEGVKKAKGELYAYLYENDGVAFVNYDNELLEDLKPPHSIIYYGTKGFTHCQGKVVSNDFYLSLRWMVTDDIINDEKYLDWDKIGKLVQTQLYGTYNFENVMAAICIGNNFNVSDADIKEAIETYKPKNNRSEICKTTTNTLLVDCYNANPSSIKAALDNFANVEVKPKVVILGDMLELGTASIREHGVIIGVLKEMNFNNVFLVGESFYNYKGTDNMLFFKEVKDLNEHLLKEKIKNAYVLIKGSRGMQLETILDLF